MHLPHRPLDNPAWSWGVRVAIAPPPCQRGLCPQTPKSQRVQGTPRACWSSPASNVLCDFGQVSSPLWDSFSWSPRFHLTLRSCERLSPDTFFLPSTRNQLVTKKSTRKGGASSGNFDTGTAVHCVPLFINDSECLRHLQSIPGDGVSPGDGGSSLPPLIYFFFYLVLPMNLEPINGAFWP